MAELQVCLAKPKRTTDHPPHRLQAPPANSKELFLGHAALEETYGLAKRSMEVYDAAVRTVPPEERLEVYNLFVSRASQFFGVGKVGCSTAGVSWAVQGPAWVPFPRSATYNAKLMLEAAQWSQPALLKGQGGSSSRDLL